MGGVPGGIKFIVSAPASGAIANVKKPSIRPARTLAGRIRNVILRMFVSFNKRQPSFDVVLWSQKRADNLDLAWPSMRDQDIRNAVIVNICQQYLIKILKMLYIGHTVRVRMHSACSATQSGFQLLSGFFQMFPYPSRPIWTFC